MHCEIWTLNVEPGIERCRDVDHLNFGIGRGKLDILDLLHTYAPRYVLL